MHFCEYRFKAIKVSDAGYYTCEAENRLGHSEKEMFIDVFGKMILLYNYKNHMIVLPILLTTHYILFQKNQ